MCACAWDYNQDNLKLYKLIFMELVNYHHYYKSLFSNILGRIYLCQCLDVDSPYKQSMLTVI